MRTRRIGCAAVVAALIVVAVLTRGPARPTPNPPGAFSFAVLGDAPYYAWEEPKFALVLRDLDAHDLAFAIDIGDIFWRPCTDEHYRWVLDRLDALRHPVVYTPGDNETFDCWQRDSGAFAPQSRFARVRQIFFGHPTRSLGRAAMPLVSQGGEFVENARWSRDGFLCATVDMIGSKNGLMMFPGRTPEDDAAAHRRTEAAAAWVRETFAAARASNAPAVILAFHANADLEDPPDADYRRAFEPFLSAVEGEAKGFARPVLLVHGDGHEYIVDHPLRCCANVTRMQVPGSPLVGWVRVVVRPGAANPFAFEERVIPRWKYW